MSATAARSWPRAPRADAGAALLQHLLQDRDAAGHRAGREAGGADAGRARTTSSSPPPARRPTTPSCAWCGTSGTWKGKPEKKTIISRTYGYHGSTMAAASLGGMAAMHGQADLPLPGFVHVMPPYWYDYGGDLSPEAFGRRAAQGAGGQDPRARPGPRRRLHRRADPGRRRRDHPAGRLLAGDPAHLPPARRAADRRRGDLRLRAHRAPGSPANSTTSSPTS